MTSVAKQIDPAEPDIRPLLPIFGAGIRALEATDWRPGMSAEALVAPIMLAVLVKVSEGLRLGELQAAAAPRCRSCDHLVALHQQDGCCYTVAQVAQGQGMGCPCTAPRTEAPA